jgi:hypothetical protein
LKKSEIHVKKVLLIAVPLLLVLIAAAYLTFRRSDASEPRVVRALNPDRPYLLQPDRRLLLAVSEVPRLLAKIEEPRPWLPYRGEATKVEFTGGVWQIHYGSEKVGTLHELPDFEEALTLLTQWASRRAKSERIEIKIVNGRKPTIADALSELKVIEAGVRIDQEWNGEGPDTALLREAARTSAVFSALPGPTRVG